MKVEELMIGDYVKFLGRVRKIKSIIKKDTGVEISFEGENPVVVSLDEIEPIPLTPEILEKNGFEKQLTVCDDDRDICINVELNYGLYCYLNEDDFEVVGDGNNIKFVHQLQHALRLCGIEKEIEL